MTAATENTVDSNVTQGTAFFDLLDYTSKIQCADVAAQVAKSVAFRIDLSINSAVRTLMKNLRAYHAEFGIATMSDMTRAMQDEEFAREVLARFGVVSTTDVDDFVASEQQSENVVRDFGKDDLGPIATIHQLNAIRQQWHQLAADLTGMTVNWEGAPREYAIPDIEELLLREVKLSVKPETARRIRIQIERRAAADESITKDDIDTVYKRRMEREEQEAAQASATLMDQQGTIVTLYTLVSERAKDEAVNFYDLDARLRRNLIEAALVGANRADDYAAKYAKTDSEFNDVNFSVIRVERELKAVLKGSAYAQLRAMD